MADPGPPPAESLQHPDSHAGGDPSHPPATAAEHPHLSRQRLSDGQAFGLLAAWFVFRTITQRVGLGIGPKLLDSKPWVIPLLNNSSLLLIQAGTGTAGRPGMLIATGLASVFMSTIVALVLYWAGWRFGHRLAHMAARPGSPWAGVWNPKQIARAERWMDRWGMGIIVIGKVTEYFILPITLVAGASEMRFRRFIIANTIGSIGFAGVWLWVGGEAQERWPWLKDWISDTYGPWALRIGLALIVLLVLLMLLGSAMDKKQPDDGAETSSDEAAPEPAAAPDTAVAIDPAAAGDQVRETITPSQPSSVIPPENDDPSRSRPVDS
jgi:membrane-associated protein